MKKVTKEASEMMQGNGRDGDASIEPLQLADQSSITNDIEMGTQREGGSDSMSHAPAADPFTPTFAAHANLAALCKA